MKPLFDFSTIKYDKYIEDLVQKLQQLVQVPSVYDASTVSQTTPYGKSIADALALVSDWAIEDGFKVTQYDGHAILVEVDQPAKSNERFDVISHLDVVDIGQHWTYPPFGGVIENGRMYGRGTNDMKRAAVLMYFILKIIQDYQIPMTHRLCVIYGTDEETNMSDLGHYLEKEGAPDFAITPDTLFPLSIGEKGATSWEIALPLSEDTAIIDIKGGEGINNVPSLCKVTVPLIDYQRIQEYRRQKEWPLEMAPMNQGLQITVKGKAAHASSPELGENAIIRALTLVRDLFHDDFASDLVEAFGENDGSGLGVACSSDKMGPLTINLGTISINDDIIVLGIDSRFPEVTTSELITNTLWQYFPNAQDIKRLFDTDALLYPLEKQSCKVLQQLFKKHYPTHSQALQLKGGVTYAKIVPNCVAFGMNFEGDPELAHQTDEYIELDNLQELLAFYTEVIVTIGQLPTLKN